MYESAPLSVAGTSSPCSSGHRVSIVVPIYNEAENLPKFLKALDELKLACEKELILIDDCSGDGSRALLESFEFSSRTILICHSKNKGKGSAVRAGVAAATGNFVGIQDADFEYDMLEIAKVLEPLLLDQADVVYGSRFLTSRISEHRSYHYLGNRFLTVLSNVFSGLGLSDMETCYKFFRSEILRNLVLESDRFGFEPEVTAKIARLNLRLREVSVSYHPRGYGQGKKITWKDGVAALWHIVRFNVLTNHRDVQKQVPNKFQRL